MSGSDSFSVSDRHYQSGWLSCGDAIRAVGIVAVVLAHVAQEGTRADEQLSPAAWWSCSLLDAAGRWAVPCFLMLSGAIFLRLSAQESPAAFYRRRLRRLGIPLVFWMVFYLFWQIFFWNVSLSGAQIVAQLLSGATSVHLHFLAVVLGLYLFTPMLRIYIHHAPPGQVSLTAVLILFLALLSGAVDFLQGRDMLYQANLFNRFVPYLGYYLLGYCLRGVIPRGRYLLLAWGGFLAGVVLTAAGTWVLHQFLEPGRGAMYFYSQVSVTRALTAVCAFVIFAGLFRADRVLPRWLNRLFQTLASASLGVYLIHVVFLDLLFVCGVRTTGLTGLIDRLGLGDHPVGIALAAAGVELGLPVRLVGVYLASLLAILILMRLPYLRRLVS